MSYLGTIAILPQGEVWINPARLATHALFDPQWVAYVLRKTSEERTRPTRVLTSHGGLGWKLGDEMRLVHDQTTAYLGGYAVVGVSRADNGHALGAVPDRLIKHGVIK